jgi:hypothetical protein
MAGFQHAARWSGFVISLSIPAPGNGQPFPHNHPIFIRLMEIRDSVR